MLNGMEKDDNSKNIAKLAKLQKQIKSGQEKLKTSVKKLAPPKKKAKREYAHFPARDNEGRLIRHPVRKRKFEDTDQNKEEGNLNLNVEPSVQQDDLMSTINANISKSVDELKIKIEQLRNATKSNNRTIWEKRKQRETENWANLRQCLFEAVIKTKFANPPNVCSKCQYQTVCLIRTASISDMSPAGEIHPPSTSTKSTPSLSATITSSAQLTSSSSKIPSSTRSSSQSSVLISSIVVGDSLRLLQDTDNSFSFNNSVLENKCEGCVKCQGCSILENKVAKLEQSRQWRAICLLYGDGRHSLKRGSEAFPSIGISVPLPSLFKELHSQFVHPNIQRFH
ncbi:uncharacterized protein LOC125679139 isoform X2 [Ostrea edulis]|uniref:uncharacterized protein LOC125679139 isoform X2 n=1 Tax=Ostrea edulis TaxID=37623 RepID=UPI0024AF86CF|nr:uncharacterized protein LOC125679139 isoform X2 [Ostrea edulis]